MRRHGSGFNRPVPRCVGPSAACTASRHCSRSGRLLHDWRGRTNYWLPWHAVIIEPLLSVLRKESVAQQMHAGSSLVCTQARRDRRAASADEGLQSACLCSRKSKWTCRSSWTALPAPTKVILALASASANHTARAAEPGRPAAAHNGGGAAAAGCAVAARAWAPAVIIMARPATVCVSYLRFAKACSAQRVRVKASS